MKDIPVPIPLMSHAFVHQSGRKTIFKTGNLHLLTPEQVDLYPESMSSSLKTRRQQCYVATRNGARILVSEDAYTVAGGFNSPRTVYVEFPRLYIRHDYTVVFHLFSQRIAIWSKSVLKAYSYSYCFIRSELHKVSRHVVWHRWTCHEYRIYQRTDVQRKLVKVKPNFLR